MAENYKNWEEEQALKRFLLDIECLDPIIERTNKFNLFDILKITRTEIRHSNMLSWLLNPNENHGFDDCIIKGVIQYVIASFRNTKDVFETLLMDCHEFIIYREWRNIDLLAISAEEEFLICIENKVGSGEHSNQLKRYRRKVEEAYPNYRKMYIFLSPEGVESSEPEYWCSMGYQDILDIIESAYRKVKLFPDAKLLADNYMEAIRRDIVEDEKLAQICMDIYAKHQKALDLIFENKPDKMADVGKVIKQWAIARTEENKLEIVLEKTVKSCIRFKTKTMSEILPDAKEARSGWKTKNYYFYEVANKGDKFNIRLSISSRNIPKDLMDICERINAYHPANKNSDWQWRTPFSTSFDTVGEDVSSEEIYEKLDMQFASIIKFEQQLKEKLEQENK